MGLEIIKTGRNMSAAIFLVNFMIILLEKPSPSCAAAPVLTLYSGDGRSLTLSGRNAPNLKELDFDNDAESCEAQGWWILYADYNYHGSFQIVKDTYKDLEHGFHGKVSSARLIGSSDDSTESTLTLYQGINFQGSEYYNPGANSNLDVSASSLIVTGTAPWTLYSSSNYGGKSDCINPGVMYDTHGLQSIRSVRRGCFK